EKGFIDGHGADGDRAALDVRDANFVEIATGGKVHHGVGAEVHGGVQFFELAFDVAGHRRVTDVGVDFGLGVDANRHRLEVDVVDIGRDDHAATSDFGADELRLDFFAGSNIVHFLGDNAILGEVHL